MHEIKISYAEMIEFWRDSKSSLLYEDKTNWFDLHLPYKGALLVCQVNKDTSDGDDFEIKKAFANKVIKAKPETIWTHDYTSSASWPDTDNSLYSIPAPTDKRLDMHSATVVCDAEMSFGTGTIYMVIWQGLNAPCPELGANRTPFNDVAFNPGVSAGWIQQQKPWGGQEVATYIYLSIAGVPQYACVAFAYDSIDDIVTKSNFKQFGNRLLTQFEFIEPVVLRSSMNERIECYIDNDTAITSPNGIPAKAVFHCGSTDEF